jgi:hypothetical protein
MLSLMHKTLGVLQSPLQSENERVRFKASKFVTRSPGIDRSEPIGPTDPDDMQRAQELERRLNS